MKLRSIKTKQFISQIAEKYRLLEGRMDIIEMNPCAGFTIEEVFNLTKIDRWILAQIKKIVDFAEELAASKR